MVTERQSKNLIEMTLHVCYRLFKMKTLTLCLAAGSV